MGNDTYSGPYSEPIGTVLTTHPGPTLATADRLRELVRLIGPRWDVLGMLDAVLYDWEPRLAALVPPIPATPAVGRGQDGEGDILAGIGRSELDAVRTPSQAPHVGRLIFGDEPYEFHRKARGGKGRR